METRLERANLTVNKVKQVPTVLLNRTEAYVVCDQHTVTH